MWALVALCGIGAIVIGWVVLDGARPTYPEPAGLSGVGVALAAMVLPPLLGVFAEVLFRGVILPHLARSWGPLVALLATSLIFAAGHAVTRGGLGVTPLYFAYGLVFGAMALRRRSVFAAVLAHAVWNLLVG